MKVTNKITLLALCAMISACMFVSCSSDDENNEENGETTESYLPSKITDDGFELLLYYDNNNRITKIIENEDGTTETIFEYDSEGNPTIMKERYAENSVFEEWTVTQYRYSKKIDSVFVTEFKTGSTTDIYEIDTLLINEKGQLLKYLDNDDNSQYEITYSYNADGSLKQEHIHVIDQMSDREFTTTYKYSKYKGIGSQINIKPWFALRNGGNLIQLFNLTDETETGKVTEPDGNIIISPEKKIKYEYTYYDTGYPKTMKETGSRDDNYLYSIEYIKAK